MANSAEAAWKTVREINLADIRKAALLPLKVALVGNEDELSWMQDRLSGGSADPGDVRRLREALRLYESPVTAEMLEGINGCTFACLTPNAAEQIHRDRLNITVPLFTLGNEGEWEHFKREILETRWDLHLTIGRNLPGLRPEVIEYAVTNMATVNAEVAVLSALFARIPGVGPIYPGVVFGDTLILTKNQIMLIFRLAGACGASIDLVHRKAEVLAALGWGFGLRMGARAIVGLVPVIGIPLKGAIAYAGTYVVGKTAAHFFITGQQLSKADRKALFRSAMEAGKKVASEALQRFLRRRKPFRRRGNRSDQDHWTA